MLVTDRPFLHPVDGSAHTYLMWLHVLLGLGCRVSVLSFSRFSSRWSADEVQELASIAPGSLILDAFADRRRAAASGIVSIVWRSLAGRRYLPLPAERLLRHGQHERIATFLRDGSFDAIVVNKLLTTVLVGRDLLQAHPAIKLIDVHDNFPMREKLNGQVLFSLSRQYPSLFRSLFKPREIVGLLSWASQGRLLQEEARLLAPFDHVIFNARQEAEIYERAGVPRAKLAVLPLPRPPERAEAPGNRTRPYAIGLIASGSLSNVEGVAFLAREVLPALRDRGVRLLVAGTIGRLAARLLPAESTTVLGWIDEVSTFYEQVEVVLVPLLTGTGVSVKTMEAAAHGAAIVTTSVGARGVELTPGRDMLVADGGPAFVAAILRLLDDPAERASLRANAPEALRIKHSRDAFSSGVAALLSVPEQVVAVAGDEPA